MTSEAHITSDMDLVGPDGKLWMRLEGWEDRRFDLPMEFFKFLLAPVDGLISEPCTSAVAQFPASLQVQCRRLKNPFHSDRSFWTRVWSRLTLSAAERRTFEELRGPETRRMDWLLGRMVAKDAVRLLMKQVCNLELCPTDVQIVSDGRGQPVPQGPWTRDMDRVPALSLAHTEGGMAVAIASLGEQPVRVGVDVERIRCQPAGFEEVAFAPDERALLNSLQGAAKGEWMIRLWCAKEAVAKCLGSGLVEGPASVVIRSLDLETGVVLATVQGKLTSEFPELVEAGVQVNTTIDGEYAVASALWEAC